LRLELDPITSDKRRYRTQSMSVLPPKADMCVAITDVRFGPEGDIGRLFGHFISTAGQRSSAAIFVATKYQRIEIAPKVAEKRSATCCWAHR
jgi:hypothetical protein